MNLDSLIPSFISSVLTGLVFSYYFNIKLKEAKKEKDELYVRYENTINFEIDKYKKTVLKEQVDLVRQEEQLKFNKFKQEETAKISKEAISKSKSVLIGKATEHVVPYFKEFPYNPNDARFLGSPIDLIVFNGISENNLQEIVFVEIKTGKSTLSDREKQVKNCVENKNVVYKKIII